MHKYFARTFCIVIATLILIHMQSKNASAFDYFIAEQTDFSGNGCEAGDVNVITYWLDYRLDQDGHVGDRIPESQVWPQYFRESCSTTYGAGGLDGSYGDSDLLTVYAGHGEPGKLYFAHDKSGICDADLGSNMRIGSMDGNSAGFAMWLTSCTLNTAYLVSDANFQWTRQQFGFHNSPSLESNDPVLMYTSTSASTYDWTNAQSWNAWMEDDYNDDETNSPIVVSYGSTAATATAVRDEAQLRAGWWASHRPSAPTCQQGQPAFYYNYVIRNNGNCP